jgi:predicted aspartyl protease
MYLTKHHIIPFLICFVLLFNTYCAAAEQNGEKVVIPFQSDNGKIIIPLRLNNHPEMLRFLFDTGADGMAIRKSLADSLQLPKGYEQQASFVGGSAQITISAGNVVHLSDSTVLDNQNIALFDAVEETDGIIGLNLAQRYRISVDFDKQQITLSSYDKPVEEIPGEVIPITDYQKLIKLPVNLNLTGDKTISGHFIFDTGANYHLIAFSRFVRKNRLLLSGFKPEAQSATVSMGYTTTVFSGKAGRFELTPNLIFTDIPIALQSSSDRNYPENYPDGSIGIFLINRYNFTLDLLGRKLYLTPR